MNLEITSLKGFHGECKERARNLNIMQNSYVYAGVSKRLKI